MATRLLSPYIPEYRSPALHVALLVMLAVALGGGGLAYALNNLIVQLSALLIIAFHKDRAWQFFREAPLALRILVVLSVALPLVQIVPLPASLWHNMPGRDLVRQSFELAEIPAYSWFPLSVDTMRSVVAFCGTLAPAAIIVIGSTLERDELTQLGWALTVAALAAFLLGVVQLATAGNSGLIYDGRADGDVLYATFANRNSAGMFFVLAVIVQTALPIPRQPIAQMLRLGAFAILAVAVILTQSRSSMVLLLVAGAFAGARLLAMRWPGLKLGWLAGAGTLIAALLAVLAVTQSDGRMRASLDRFSDISTDRPAMWEDGLYAAGRYWPAGTGMGTFDEVFQIDESLEHISPRRAGRAHNDYIELGIEAGIYGLVLLAAWFVWIGWAALQSLPGEWRWMRAGAAIGLACIAAQSLLDYPLRNQTLLCVAALLVAILASRQGRPR